MLHREALARRWPPRGFGERICAVLRNPAAQGQVVGAVSEPWPGACLRGNVPFPTPPPPTPQTAHSAHLPSSAGAPTSSTPGAPSGLHLRRTTQDRPAGLHLGPHPPGHDRKALGPRVRPRHPPGGPRDSTARVSPSFAQRSHHARLPRLLGPRPHRSFQARTRMGRGTRDHPAPSPSRDSFTRTCAAHRLGVRRTFWQVSLALRVVSSGFESRPSRPSPGRKAGSS